MGWGCAGDGRCNGFEEDEWDADVGWEIWVDVVCE